MPNKHKIVSDAPRHAKRRCDMFPPPGRCRTITKASCINKRALFLYARVAPGGSMSQSKNLGVIITASLAGLLFGFDTVVISGVTKSVGVVFHLEAGSFWYGFSVASALLGTLIGALAAGIPG